MVEKIVAVRPGFENSAMRHAAKMLKAQGNTLNNAHKARAPTTLANSVYSILKADESQYFKRPLSVRFRCYGLRLRPEAFQFIKRTGFFRHQVNDQRSQINKFPLFINRGFLG